MSGETPRPPATEEFGHVAPGGTTHRYDAHVKKFSVGEYDNNVYVITSGERSAIIDGAFDASRILSEVGGTTVAGIFQTHNHFDHTRALRELVDALGCPVYGHPADPMPVETLAVADGDVFEIGSLRLRALHTPG
ncbi:MAG: MBL fold metallo-hydrolase, partial [Actinobacteria bacterium]|nr:MBL fold metallo-hydrolase [Actinomycetota bacterium]